MASLQCIMPAITREQKCNNSKNSSGLGQEVAERGRWVTGKHGETTIETHRHSWAQHHALYAMSETETGASTGYGLSGAKPTNSVVAAGRKRRGKLRKKKYKSVLLKKKDGLSGNSSSSDSESEGLPRGRTKEAAAAGWSTPMLNGDIENVVMK